MQRFLIFGSLNCLKMLMDFIGFAYMYIYKRIYIYKYQNIKHEKHFCCLSVSKIVYSIF